MKIIIILFFLFTCISGFRILHYSPHRLRRLEASLSYGVLYGSHFLGPSPQWNSYEMIRHANLLIRSYHHLTQEELFPKSLETSISEPTAAAIKLFQDPNIFILSHGTQKQLPNGPILNYGNLNVLSLWRVSWEELTSMPSSYTVEAGEGRVARSKVMNQILTESNIIRGYEGIRINKEGERFKLLNTTIWNVFEYDQSGRQSLFLGQAATFKKVDYN